MPLPGTMEMPARIVPRPRFEMPPEGVSEARQEQIRRGLENEAAEEAKVGDRDGHAETSGGSLAGAPLTDEMDRLVDGAGGSTETAAGAASPVYTQGKESDGGAVVTEVEGYSAAATAAEAFVTPELLQFPEIVHGTDDRVRVFATTAYPWRTLCKLEIVAADGTRFGGSGAFIGPRTVLTAGHCVYMHGHGGWARQIRVIPGMNGVGVEPFGSAVSTFYRSVTGWTADQSSNYDYAVVVLPATRKLGNTVGWMGLADLSFFSLLGLNVNNSGYPGDKPYGTQWWNANNILLVTDRRVYYQIDTYGGQSGSPDWRYKDGQRHIVAIHNTGGSPFNGGVRIVEPVFNNLVAWKNAYT